MFDFFIKGGPVMWPLLLCSLAALTIALERLVFWIREGRTINPGEIERIFRCVEAGKYDEAATNGGQRSSAATRMILAGLEHRDHGFRKSMEVAAGVEIERMKQGLRILDTIITMAPLLGILGTVTGTIQCFNLLGTAESGDPRQVHATAGIAQALITTAAGLVIALVALIPFNYFSARVEKATRELEHIGTQLQVAYRRGLTHASDKRI